MVTKLQSDLRDEGGYEVNITCLGHPKWPALTRLRMAGFEVSAEEDGQAPVLVQELDLERRDSGRIRRPPPWWL
jgi:hypothetical protein